MRRKVIAGNWKMNMLPNEAIEFIDKFAPLVKDTENEVILCVPYTDLFYALLTAQNTNIKIGAQNMHFEEKGAYTGEVSAQMLKSIGVEYVIIGHSERRQYFNETDETVNKKIKAAFLNNLKPSPHFHPYSISMQHIRHHSVSYVLSNAKLYMEYSVSNLYLL